MLTSWNLLIFTLVSTLTFSAYAQIEVYDDESGSETRQAKPKTGRDAAADYFIKRKQNRSDARQPSKPGRVGDYRPATRSVASNGDRFLSLSAGVFFDNESYAWGEDNQDDVANFTAGVTYRVGEWVSSMDMNFRADITSYTLDEGDALKISMMPIVTFPDARSGFPLYFGAGGGLGVFFRQIDDESHLSFDYTIMAGARIMEVIEGMGVMMEVGMKNHVLLLSDGQFNGAYFSIGSVFEF
ncbi:MAG: hypothetical protein HRT45_03560 [Bdellovibrionales bacterium]|nr:hypothetical protein [Bdellovibrionales bacterium]